MNPNYPPTSPEMETIADLIFKLPTGSKGVEFGCGLTTEMFLDFGMEMTIVEIDERRLQKFGTQCNCIHSDSIDLQLGGEYDFAFVDGDHRYSRVAHELEMIWPTLRPGAILIGHDFDQESFDEEEIESDCVGNVHHGVIKAVKEKFPSRNREGRVWWVYKN